MQFKSRAYRPKHKPGQMNGTELKYCYYLDLLKKSGEILDYSFENTKLKLGDDCWYTPDFRVLRDNCFYCPTDQDKEKHCIIEFHEVKGTKRKKGSLDTKPFIEDDAMVKIKAAAEFHPYKFILVWEGLNGQWEKREIN